MKSARVGTQIELSYQVAAEIRAVFRKLRLRLREHGGGKDLTPSQMSVLLRLETAGTVTVSHLARAEGMRPQSMRAIVAPLLEAGLVSGVSDPGDGRQTLMSLTPKCVKWFREGRAAKQDWLAATITRKLSLREQEQLLAALEMLTRLTVD